MNIKSYTKALFRFINCKGDYYIPKQNQGDLLLFPSWLSHFVVPNQTDVVRKSVSFNIILRGKYGIDNSLQQVVL